MLDKLLNTILNRTQSVTDTIKDGLSNPVDTLSEGIRDIISDNPSLRNVKETIAEKVIDEIQVKAYGKHLVKKIQTVSLEQRAKALGISLAEIRNMSIQEQATKAGMSVKDYEDKWATRAIEQ